MRLSKWPRRRGGSLAAATAALVMGSAAAALADNWKDRTVLEFSEPVMVPNATLQPGTYVFQIANATGGRHIVEIRHEDGGQLVTLAQAVPMKRADARGDIVVRFNPTGAGTPPAVKGWFFPGSLYGHQFVYPEDQARQIAQRTKSIVLSVDVPGTDLEQGTLRLVDPAGSQTEWRGEDATAREWNAWRDARAASQPTADGGRRRATAPMVDAGFQASRVSLNDLEERTEQYMGKTVSVDGEVEDILGPRVFTIDEPAWGDLDGEMFVVVPGPLAAMVREDDRLTVTGTIKPFLRAEFEREWGWLGLDPELEVEIARKPVLQATRIVGGNDDVALILDVDKSAADRPVGTAGTAGASGALTDAETIAEGTTRLVGRRVRLTGAAVERVAEDRGFFVKAADSRLFVLPARDGAGAVDAGDTVSIEGVVLQLPDPMRDRLNLPDEAETYVYATSVQGP